MNLYSFVKWIGLFYFGLFNGGFDSRAFGVYVIFITILVLYSLLMLHLFIMKRRNIPIKNKLVKLLDAKADGWKYLGSGLFQ